VASPGGYGRRMPAAGAKSIATACLKAWTSGDLETTRTLVHDDVSFEGPLGSAQGADAYLAGLEGLSRIVTGAKVRRVFGEGGDVCIIYDLVTTPTGAVPTAGWYQVRGGKVASVQAFFDARRIIAGKH
jgi:hypothetical protein